VTDSAVRAVHVPTGEIATVTSGRSQGINREQAIAVLMARVAEREQRSRDEKTQTHRRQHVKAGRAQTTRVYDLIRDMVRCERTGKKIRRVQRILDGNLDELLT
jgi:peptide chain release factor 1